MSESIVVGGGIAGIAAAWKLAARGAVTLVDGGPGATSFASGAVDDHPWEEVARSLDEIGDGTTNPLALDDDLATFADALGLWAIGSSYARLPSCAGVVRVARGRDRGVLDLADQRGRRIAIPRVDRAMWDADALARSWAADAPSELGLRFEAVDIPVLRFSEERRVSDGELAIRHDDPARRGWLEAHLKEFLRRATGDVSIVVGPWLGASRECATEMSKNIGAPIGEAILGSNLAAGLRFEAARDALAKKLGIAVVRDRVRRIEGDGGDLRVVFASERTSIRARRLVLAIGGVVGGGLAFDPPRGGPEGATAIPRAFKLSLELAPEIALPDAFRFPGSTAGLVLDESAWPASGAPSSLETLGVAVETKSKAVAFAGDVVHGRRRTLIEASRTAIEAAKAVSASSP